MPINSQICLSKLILLATMCLVGCGGGSSSTKFQEAETLKNRGLAHMENQELEDADRLLTELATLLPDNRLAIRNLAISRLMSFTDAVTKFKPTSSGEPDPKFTQAQILATQAIEDYQQFDGDDYDSALADTLMGRMMILADSASSASFDAGLQLMRKAADQVPDEADFRFALAMEMDGHRSYSDSKSEKPGDLIQQLQQCATLVPENLFVQIKLLQKQALSLRSGNDVTRESALQMDETLSRVITMIEPFNASLREQHRGLDIVEMMNKAIVDAKAGNTNAMMGPGMMAFNVINPEVATQIDQRRINRDLLEYVLLDFDGEMAADEFAAGSSLPLAAVIAVCLILGLVIGYGAKKVLPKAPHPAILAIVSCAAGYAAWAYMVRPVGSKVVIKQFAAAENETGLTGVSKVQMLDFDLDAHDDAVVIQDGRFCVYTRSAEEGDAWQQLLTAPEGVGEVTGFLLFDLDRDYDTAITELQSPRLLLDEDGDRKIVSDPASKERWFDTDYDVLLWGPDDISILRNDLQEDGSRQLTLVPQTAQVAGVNAAVAADLDSDGDLDLVFATDSGVTLWKNLDGTAFAENESADMPAVAVGQLAACDWDRNIAMDVLAVPATGDTKSGFLQNIFHNRFRWQTSDAALQNIPIGSSVVVAEFDGRGSWDLVVAGKEGVEVRLTEKIGEAVSVKSERRLYDQPVRGAAVADLDNDGRSDVVAWGASGVYFFRSIGGGGFQDLSALLKQSGDVVDVAINDVDEDGDLDVVCIAASGKAEFLINEGGNQNNWMTVVARGKPDDSQFKSRRVNAHATGAVIELRCGQQYQSQVIADAKIHVGLGACERPDSVRLLWTDGIPQHVTVPELLRPRIGILAPQILKGSCPYIYTWTGERFEFFSDCLWAAPLGLVQANGELAPTREWENLLVPGESLVENDGRFDLQLTEELWEIAYFDQVELTAVDHPADVSIFTNEKVGPPSLAEHRIHTVKNPRIPKSVVDGRGKDLLPGLTAQDGDYVQAFQGRIMQGLTDEWVMEFDLGNVEGLTKPGDSANIRLFLLGWIFPTDTSLNLNIEQNSSLDPPAPPSIEVPDGNGGWKVARPFIGFPSGKTKAMVVDISDVFTGDDFRFRLRSSMELYWDHIFFTAGEDDAETVVQPCEIAITDLHYRGFSRRVYPDNALFRNGRAPEGYDYQSVTTDARWPPVAGRFSRYGDVTPLLDAHDDHMVVMGPGDELTISFAVPAKPVPEGWKRDFVLRNVGYDKDADLNTIYGQSSEPFPFRSMSRYPFAPDEQSPDSVEYRNYLREWQTREYSRKPFWNAVRP